MIAKLHGTCTRSVRSVYTLAWPDRVEEGFRQRCENEVLSGGLKFLRKTNMTMTMTHSYEVSNVNQEPGPADMMVLGS